MKTYSGFTTDTAKSLVLDAGAFFKNFTVGTDTFESAKTAGKLIGATIGGGEFAAVPEIRQVEVDGVKGKAKGLEIVDSWDVHINATVLEIKESVLKDALCASDAADSTTATDYREITARNNIELTDYIDNITWVGTLSGSDNPVIIQIYNALDLAGLTLTTQDKNQSSVTMEYSGHYKQDDLDTPPFKIFYPKAETDDSTEDSTDGE